MSFPQICEILRFCDFFVVLSCAVLSWLYFFSRNSAQVEPHGRILTIYGLNDAPSPNEVLFGGSEIIGVSQICIRGAATLEVPLAEKIFYPKQVLYHI